MYEQVSDFMLGCFAGCCDSDLVPLCPKFAQDPHSSKRYCYKNIKMYEAGTAYMGETVEGGGRVCENEKLYESCRDDMNDESSLSVNAFLQEFASSAMPHYFFVGVLLIISSLFSCMAALLLLPCCTCYKDSGRASSAFKAADIDYGTSLHLSDETKQVVLT